VQLDSKNEKNSTVVEIIANPFEPTEKLSRNRWLSRMNCYVHGSDKGKLRFCDIENGGDLMFVLPADFTDRVTCMHYCKEKNVLFVGARDGKFRVWKIPN